MSSEIKKNKKGQIGETMTWVVATIIIIIILAISIFISSFYLGKSKKIQESYSWLPTAGIPASKSLFSYMLTLDSEGKTVHSQLKEEDNLNEFSGNLGKKIFLEFYGKEYPAAWLGMVNRSHLSITGNDYFGSSLTVKGGAVGKSDYILEIIRLDEDKSVELFLAERKY